MRISDWSSDVCSSDLIVLQCRREAPLQVADRPWARQEQAEMAAPEFGPDIGNLRHRNPGREPFVEQRFVKGERGLELGFRKGAAAALVAQHPRPGRDRKSTRLNSSH